MNRQIKKPEFIIEPASALWYGVRDFYVKAMAGTMARLTAGGLVFGGFVFTGLAAFILPSTAATIYYSTGQFGEMRFSQLPPAAAHTALQFHEVRKGAAQSGQSANQPQNFGQAATPAHQSASQATSHASTPSQQNEPSQCQILRDNLVALNAGGSVVETDATGKRTTLTDAQISARKERINQTLLTYCQGAS
ncbi:hypothetical protein B0181_08530 [Moraxella caviae]|uniref:DUF4124 domain-containing protein n=1 Tax=Moraxella caviae TaxID=34060 RepID=A0A1S9ZXM5_9GAMM|nr:hypothetical protein [Moraxella caviae]OOR88276.1 hypothetical protein B0181_08530 [Moraxella caviae]STZ13889.1 Uncharacterised protein [Moraxella caviae]